MKEAYINFLNHCYIDTEVEMKDIYTSNHMWSLFEKSFLVDMGLVATCSLDRNRADLALESYVVNSVMNIITTFFNSPFSDQSTTVQVLYLFNIIIIHINILTMALILKLFTNEPLLQGKISFSPPYRGLYLYLQARILN